MQLLGVTPAAIVSSPRSGPSESQYKSPQLPAPLNSVFVHTHQVPSINPTTAANANTKYEIAFLLLRRAIHITTRLYSTTVTRAKMAYILTGRGGAGNVRSFSTKPSSPSRPCPASSSIASYSTSPRYVSSGIGGAGNYKVSSEAATQAALANDFISAANAAARPQVAAYVGRGGAGNIYRERQASATSVSSGASIRSDSSAGSFLSDKAKYWVASLKR